MNSTFCITLGGMTLGMMTFSITTFSIATLSIRTFNITINKMRHSVLSHLFMPNGSYTVSLK